MLTKLWHRPAVIARNNFINKSLSCWSYNMAIGCSHACRFCYVPEVSTNRMATILQAHGVNDPDSEWGDYVFIRPWNEQAFRHSLNEAMQTPKAKLNADGNRAIMLSTTTDAYQIVLPTHDALEKEVTRWHKTKPPEPLHNFLSMTESEYAEWVETRSLARFQARMNYRYQLLTRKALETIWQHSDLNVRILTRSPLARRDFDIMQSFGNRLMFGMSLPTLNNKLARIYEPKAPAPSVRLETLRAAKAAGIPIFVAVAPVYPDCDTNDMLATLNAVKELEPHTIFMEPINIRADNVQRIAAHAASHGTTLKTSVFDSPALWRLYAHKQLRDFEQLAQSVGFRDDQIHLWPDASLGSAEALKQCQLVNGYSQWLNRHWNKISAWPAN